MEEFIIEEAERLKSRSDFRIIIQVEEYESSNENEIPSIIHRHFESKRENENHEVKKILGLGLRSLLIGFVFLVIIFLLTKALMSYLPENAFIVTVREFFIILGWVALWRPADLLLYEWRPYKRNALLFDRLVKCEVHVTG